MDGPRPPDVEEILAELHEAARGRLKEELLPGERLLWAGRGHQEPVRPFGYALAVLLLLGLVAASLAALRFAFHSTGRDADGLVVTGILTGLAAVITAIAIAGSLKSVADRRKARRQHLYALTDRRLILRTPTLDRRGVEIRAFDLPLIGNIHRIEYADGLGAVGFRTEAGSRIKVDLEHGGVEPVDSFTMEKIPEARRVELLLRQTIAEHASRVAGSTNDLSPPKEFA